MLLVVLGIAGCATPEPPPTLDAPSEQASSSAASVELSIAGSAVATPLIRHLAQVFQSRVPGPTLVVEAPLGDGGGQAALTAGRLAGAVFTAALDDETPGVVFARSEVVLAVGPGVRTRDLDADQLGEMLAGRAPRWPGGTPLRIWLRPIDDPLQQQWLSAHPKVEGPLTDAVVARRWPVALREDAVRSALRTPGALVITDRGNLSLHGTPSWVVRLGDDLPVAVELRIRVHQPAPPRIAAFVAFIAGDEGQSLVADLGFLPVRAR